MQIQQPFETKEHSLTGHASVDLNDETDFTALAIKLIDHYDPDRFEPLALRFFIEKKEPVITFYALDKFGQEKQSVPKDKLPVRKFKINVSFEEFVNCIKRVDFTVTNNTYDLKDILVTNK